MRQLWAVAALLMLATTASASITITDGPGGTQPDENVIFNGSGVVLGPANTVTGRTNKSSFLLDMISTSEIQAIDAAGQARIVPSGADGFDDLLFSNLRDPLGSTSLLISALEFNIDALFNGSLLIEVFSGVDGTGLLTSGIFDLNKNGQNFYNIRITSDTDIGFGSVRISSSDPNDNFAKVEQIRVQAAIVPEPASLVVWSLLGVGGIASVIWRRRQTA